MDYRFMYVEIYFIMIDYDIYLLYNYMIILVCMQCVHSTIFGKLLILCIALNNIT